MASQITLLGPDLLCVQYGHLLKQLLVELISQIGKKRSVIIIMIVVRQVKELIDGFGVERHLPAPHKHRVNIVRPQVDVELPDHRRVKLNPLVAKMFPI